MSTLRQQEPSVPSNLNCSEEKGVMKMADDKYFTREDKWA